MVKVKSRPFTPNGKPAKRARTAYMRDSDDERNPVKAAKKNLESPKKRKKGVETVNGRPVSIQEQRKLLPISQGMS